MAFSPSHELRLLGVALQFLTRLPMPRRLGHDPAWLPASARHFPAVGLLVGAFGAAVLAAAAAIWPWSVAVGLSMAATVWLTGGFHEDGLADTCDGLGGAAPRERALAIMKDSRLGTYGALGLAGVLGLKAASLYTLGPAAAGWALLLGHAASRAVAVTLIRTLAYAGDAEAAKAKPLAQQVSGAGWWVALGWAGAVAIVLMLAGRLPGVAVAAGLLGAVMAGLFCAHWFRRRLGGFTGDTLGAAQQLSELAIYLGLLAALG